MLLMPDWHALWKFSCIDCFTRWNWICLGTHASFQWFELQSLSCSALSFAFSHPCFVYTSDGNLSFFLFWNQESLGYVQISLSDVVSNKRINQKYHLIDSKNGQIQIELQWRTAEWAQTFFFFFFVFSPLNPSDGTWYKIWVLAYHLILNFYTSLSSNHIDLFVLHVHDCNNLTAKLIAKWNHKILGIINYWVCVAHVLAWIWLCCVWLFPSSEDILFFFFFLKIKHKNERNKNPHSLSWGYSNLKVKGIGLT